MFRNRHERRVGDKTFRRLLKGLKPPGSALPLLGFERLERLRKLAAAVSAR